MIIDKKSSLSIQYLYAKRFFTFLLYIYIFFIVFDGIRETLALPNFIFLFSAILRDLALVSLFILCIFCNKKLKHFGQTTIYFLLLCSLPAIMAITISQEDFLLSLRGVYWYIRFGFLFFILINSENLNLNDNSKMIKYIIFLTLCLFGLSLIIYFKFPHLVYRRYFGNRAGLGNPGIQSCIYFISLVLCIQYEPFGKIVNIIISIVYIIALVLGVTSTAIVALLLLLLLLLFDPSKRNAAIRLIVIGIVCIGVFVFFYSTELKNIFDFFQHRWDELIQLFEKTFSFSNVKTKSTSFNTREKQIQNFFINLRPIAFLFGNGKFGINYPKERIENLYFAVFHDYGIIGFIFLIVVLIRMFFLSIVNFIKTRQIIQFISVLSFSIYGITLIPPMAVNMGGMFVLLFYFSFYWQGESSRNVDN
jgi:hypothetical protein